MSALERATPQRAAILGKGVIVKGEIHSSEPLTIEGEVEGSINLHRFERKEMSPGSVFKDARAQVETFRPDRRLHPRYPITLGVHYKLPNQDPAKQTGSGKTRSISSGEIFFETKNRLPEGSEIYLAIDWPCLLDGACRLMLVVHGSVVRGDAKGTAVKFSRYEFRTRKAQPPRT